MNPVLIVEDDEDDALLLKHLLLDMAIHNPVLVLLDGEAAVEYLRIAQQYPPTLMFLDLNLPRMNGFEVLEATRKNPMTSAMPVVIFTTSEDDESRIRGFAGGTNAYAKKPLDCDTLTQALRQCGLNLTIGR